MELDICSVGASLVEGMSPVYVYIRFELRQIAIHVYVCLQSDMYQIHSTDKAQNFSFSYILV